MAYNEWMSCEPPISHGYFSCHQTVDQINKHNPHYQHQVNKHTHSSDEDMITLMRLDNGLNLTGIESHVLRPIITAFILSSCQSTTQTTENRNFRQFSVWYFPQLNSTLLNHSCAYQWLTMQLIDKKCFLHAELSIATLGETFYSQEHIIIKVFEILWCIKLQTGFITHFNRS